MGQSDKVFFALCQDPDKLNNDPTNLVIRRERFMKRFGGLSASGPPFRMVVRQLIASKKWAVETIRFRELSTVERKLSKQQPGSRRVQSDPGTSGKAKAKALRRSCSLDVISESPATMKPAPNPADVQPDVVLPQSAAAPPQVEAVAEGSKDAPLPDNILSTMTIKNGVQPKKRQGSKK